MHVFGSSELIEDVLNKDLCIWCGACVELCPYFKNYKGKSPLALGIRQDSIELGVKMKTKDKGERVTISFPEK